MYFELSFYKVVEEKILYTSFGTHKRIEALNLLIRMLELYVLQRIVFPDLVALVLFRISMNYELKRVTFVLVIQFWSMCIIF